ncbi:MAG: hypothetical protein AAF789_00285 [Bacteroidota bacterium]
MTKAQITELNDKLQRMAAELSELLPEGELLKACTSIIRACQKSDNYFGRLLTSTSEREFTSWMSKLEEELDEILFTMDQLEISNQKKGLGQIDDFIRKGYTLVSIYSKCCDFIISKKTEKEE